MGNKSYTLQSGFTTGELSPRLDGQVDFEKYGQGCKLLQNFIPIAQGPAVKRPGFRYIAPTKYANKKVRLIPFEFSTEQAYILEFGDHYIRFFKNQGQLHKLDSTTKLLLSFNGSDASKTIIDSGETVHTVTANGDAQIDTEYKKFGSGSCMFDGYGDYLTIPKHADFDFSSGTFTIDFWIRPRTITGQMKSIFSQETNGSNSFTIYMDAVGKVFCELIKNSVSVIVLESTQYLQANNWYHIAVVENGNNWNLYINGVSQDSFTTIQRCANYTSNVFIGIQTFNGSNFYPFNGWIDEFRICNGLAAWTSNFIPSTNGYKESDGTIYEISSNYSEDELEELQYAQSADILYIVHPNHYPAKLSRLADTDWTLTDINFQKKYYPAIGMLTGDFGSYTLGTEKVQNGTMSVDSKWTKGTGWTIANGKARKTSGNTNTLAQNTAEVAGEIYKVTYTLTLTSGTGITVKIGNILGTQRTNSGIYTEYIAADTDDNLAFVPATDFVGSIDNVSVQKATPTNYANCIDDDLSTLGFNNDIDGIGTTLELNTGVDNAIELVRIDLNIQNSRLNSVFDIEYYDPVLAGGTWLKAKEGWDLTNEDLGWSTTTWDSVGSWQRWRLLKTNDAQAGGNVMEVEFIVTGTPKEWVSGKYPACVTFFEERLWFAYLQTIWASKSGDFYNFTFGTLDDSALKYTIGSNKVNKIQWMSPGKLLVIGTSGGEYKVSASSLEEAITPLNIRIVSQSSYGSAYYPAMAINEIVLYLTRSRRKIREFTYSFEDDVFVSPDMTLLANHLFAQPIKSMTYQQEPFSCLWCVRDDGLLLGFTYQRLEGITAWHRHYTDGNFKNVACIPNTTGKGYNELWAVVQRYVNDTWIRYIEMMENEWDSDTLNSNDVFFVDSGLSYDGISTNTVLGLNHLEGKTVSVFADGIQQTSKQVLNGSITLDNAASKINAGLNYESILQTMRMERKDQFGTGQGRRKRINQLVIRLYKTLKLKYGSIPSGELKEKIFNSLFSGDWEADQVLGWDREGYVTIYHNYASPCTVLAIIPEGDIN
jgi:hypothetical protein